MKVCKFPLADKQLPSRSRTDWLPGIQQYYNTGVQYLRVPIAKMTAIILF